MLIDESSEPSGWSLPHAAGKSIVFGAMIVVLTLGAVLTVLLWQQADQDTARSERETALRVADRLSAEVRVLTAGMGSASSIVGDDGSVERSRFTSFADQVTAATLLQTVAFEPLVLDDDRAQFEQRLGSPIRDIGAGGQWAAAPRRDRYSPVQWIQPLTDTTRPLLGFDVAFDASRSSAVAAATETRGLQFTPPILSQPDSTVSFFVVTSVSWRGQVVGFVSSAVAGSALFDSLHPLVPSDVRVSVLDGDEPLFGSGRAGHRTTVRAGNREWQLFVDEADPGHTEALTVLMMTALLTAATSGFLLRNRRQAVELETAARSVRDLGRVSEQLSTAGSTEQLMGIAEGLGASPIGAQACAIALRRTAPATPGSEGVRSATSSRLLHDVLDRVLETGATHIRHAESSPRRQGRGDDEWRTAVAMPLMSADAQLVGAIGWAWTDAIWITGRTRSTIEALHVLWQNCVERVRSMERAAGRAAALYQLGQDLSVARQVAEMASATARHGPAASGFDAVALGCLVEADSVLRVHFNLDGSDLALQAVDIPVVDADELLTRLRNGEELTFDSGEAINRAAGLDIVGEHVHRLRLLPLRDSGANLLGTVAFLRLRREPVIDMGYLRSIADLLAQTMERAALFEEQDELVLQLQQRTLPMIPHTAGVEIAARYDPAVRNVGVGGDWYDVQAVAERRTVLVVGDVVGHGITAVIDMVEVSAIVTALARSDVSLDTLPEQANILLDDPNRQPIRLATAVVVQIDTEQRTLQYVRLGHPPPILLDAQGRVTILGDATNPPIGVSGERGSAATVAYLPGSTLVLYTDGLVERRGERLDVGIARLEAAVRATAAMDLQQAIDRLVELATSGHETVDDVALLLVRLS